VHLLLWGNSFSEIERNGRGDVVALWPIHPTRIEVSVKTIEGVPQLAFDVRQKSGSTITLMQNQVLLVSGLGYGILGKSPIQLHREGLGISVAAEQYGGKFFKNDARPGFVLTHPGTMGDEAFERFRDSWKKTYEGSGNAHRVAILEEGMKPEDVGLPPGDAQFIETRKYQRSEVASIYRVPPHMIGDLEKATFSNIEHQGIEFVVHSLRPWLVRIEQAINMQLLMPAERGDYFAQHIVDGLLRGDTQSRFEAYTKARNWGWMNADDIRELENMNPLPDGIGQIYLQPLNMVPAGTDPAAERAIRSQLLLPGDAPSKDGLPTGEIEMRATPPRVSAAKALQPVYLDVFTRIVKREIAEIKRAVKKYLEGDDREGFRNWLTEFVEEHASWMAPRLLPVFQSMAEAMIDAANSEVGGEIAPEDLSKFVTDYTEASANRHAGGGRGQLEALLDEEDAQEAIETRLDEWSETRADKTARRERERSSGAMTQAAWVVAGVIGMTWRTVGNNCPICQEMDGRSTLVSVPFLGKGANVAGLVTSHSVSHPPLHDGCDCYLIPDVGRSELLALEERDVKPKLESIIAEASQVMAENHTHHG